MLPIENLNFGFRDAESYRSGEQSHFRDVFLRTKSLDKLCEENIYFLMGEKGTGKTAYAVYLTNESYKNISAQINFISETEYQKFVDLKEKKHLEFSDFEDIWKVILYLLISQKISVDLRKSKRLFHSTKFRNLIRVIDEFYMNARMVGFFVGGRTLGKCYRFLSAKEALIYLFTGWKNVKLWAKLFCSQ